MPTLAPSKEVTIFVPTEVGTVRKTTSFKEARELKTVIVGVKTVEAPASEGRTVPKEAIAKTCWSTKPDYRERDVKVKMRNEGLRTYSYTVLPAHIVPIRETQAETRLEAALRRYQTKGEPFTVEAVVEEAAVLLTIVIDHYPELYRRLLKASSDSQGGSRRA